MVRHKCFLVAALAVALLAATRAQAEVTLNRLFSDNGILQRDTEVTIWGTTDKPDPVTVKFADQSVTATPEDGKWQVKLAALEASATPRELTVTQGDQTLTLKNIVVGDIWVCGGQSNMQWAINQSAGAAEAVATAGNPNLRLFTVPRRGEKVPQSTLPEGNWVESSPETIPGFSAVGYYFGRDLEKAVKVPIGLLSSNLGGTTAERWMAIEAIDSNPEIKDMHATQGKSDLYNAMLAPLAPLAVKGAIWYQGESNADRPYNYRHVLKAMIEDWRRLFNNEEMPFLIVELAPFHAKVNEPVDQEWATVRESMQWVAANTPKVATVSIVDIGDERDIHPGQKQPVGARLALAARAVAYGESITPAGPQFDSMTVEGNKATIKFKNVGGGLVAKGDELTGFTIAGEDKKFHNAQAKIEGDTVVVTSDAVSQPKAVRLGWANYPVVNLWNKDGLPAHPFRTDNWEVLKQNVK